MLDHATVQKLRHQIPEIARFGSAADDAPDDSVLVEGEGAFGSGRVAAACSAVLRYCHLVAVVLAACFVDFVAAPYLVNFHTGCVPTWTTSLALP